MTLRSGHEKPVYVRLRETIADSILSGKYRDGDPLPSVRVLVAEEQANPLTVAKAYQGFQDEGLVTVRRGVGLFVAGAVISRFTGRSWLGSGLRLFVLGGLAAAATYGIGELIGVAVS